MVRRGALWLSVTLLAGTATVIGCSPETRHRVLSTLFEGVPKQGEKAGPGPVVRRPRRPPQPGATPPPVVAEAPEEPPKPVGLPAWAEFARTLPKDASGGVDWARALEEKVIDPTPGIEPEAKDQPVFPLDVELVPEGQPLFKVTFPHGAHTRILACANCHTAIFQMKAGGDPITMAKIFAGEYCGRCHGKVSFAVPTGCARCHLGLAPPAVAAPAAAPEPPKEPAVEKMTTFEQVARALPRDAVGGVDWVKAVAEGLVAPRSGIDPRAPAQPPLDLDIERVPAGQPALKVVFPHKAHTQWLACTNCHPGIFQMKKGANPITMEKIFAGEYCGRCHGKVSFAVPTGCARCHPAMGGGQ